MDRHGQEAITTYEKVAALRSSEEYLRRLFDESPIAMWEQDFSLVRKKLDKLRRDGVTSFKECFRKHPQVATGLMSMVTISRVNRAALEMFKADRKEFLRFGLNAIYGEKNVRAFAAEMVAVAEGQTSFENEITTCTLAGDMRDVVIRWKVSPSYEDSFSSVLVGALDITQRCSAEDMRKEMESRARQFDKLESLSEMAGKIAHDFNNILMAVLGYVEMLGSEFQENSNARDLLSQIESVTHRAADLTLQLQTYSGKRHPVITPVDANKFVEEMEEQLREKSLVKAIVKIDTQGNAPLMISADTAQLRQVIHALVTNAVEAIGDKVGIITLRTGVVECDKGYLRSLHGGSEKLNAGEYVFMEVVDTGCGMNSETISRLFTPFFSTKGRRAALAMSVVLGTMRSHNGAISVTSELRCGTSIKLLFPRSETPVQVKPKEAAQGWKGSGAVLVIDDEAMIRDVLGFMLKNLGFSVLAAADGQAGVDLYRQHENEIVAVLLDLVMPGMSSEDTLKEIRRINSKAPVLLSTGASDATTKEQFGDDRIAAVIYKPYQQTSLAEALRTLLEKAQQ